MKNLVIGGDCLIGARLAKYLGAESTSRREGSSRHFYDLSSSKPVDLPNAETIYLVASMTRFRDCEIHPDAYAVNVDAQVAIAAHFMKPHPIFNPAHIVYISSEAAEWPNQTAYGSQKRCCEMSLLSVCGYSRLSVIRPRKVVTGAVDALCCFIADIGNSRMPGVHRWDWKPVSLERIAA